MSDIKDIDIPETYGCMINRGVFERSRSMSNAAFLLSEHLDDKDPSYLHSDEWMKIVKRAEEALADERLIIQAVIYEVLGDDFPADYFLKEDNEQVFAYTLFYKDKDRKQEA